MTENKNFQDFETAEAESSRVNLIRVDQMYESLRYNDYSAQNGLGEIVDNSVEAQASEIHIITSSDKVRKANKKRASDTITEICVVDNGCGMDKETLHKCLALGESIRPHNTGKRGIGRFGVGMTLGSISLARRIEVFSRTHLLENFFYTYIDLDEIQNGNLIAIPEPVCQDPPEEYKHFIEKSSGTIVILKKCDRVEGETDNFGNYLGRTYRKFIERGLTITLNGETIYLHDPLFLAGPTFFDVQKKANGEDYDLKATLLGEERISLPIPDSEIGETADVVIRMSLLPKEWRTSKGAGGGAEAKKRKIDQNEGVSILRADREVLYACVPYITGKKGEARSIDIDRWWGCEISFPPELDGYFQVRYIKRGAEPIGPVKDAIRQVIAGTVKTARTIISQDRAIDASEKDTSAGAFGHAEETMAKAAHKLPVNKRGRKLSKEEDEHKVDSLASAALSDEDKNNQEKKEQKKEEIRKKPYSIEPVSYPQSILFETVHLLNNTVIKLNVNHPFYKQVLQPLCGGFDNANADAVENQHKQDIKNAILLLLFSYAKAEAMFEDEEYEGLFDSLRNQWGTALATALNQYEREAKQ